MVGFLWQCIGPSEEKEEFVPLSIDEMLARLSMKPAEFAVRYKDDVVASGAVVDEKKYDELPVCDQVDVACSVSPSAALLVSSGGASDGSVCDYTELNDVYPVVSSLDCDDASSGILFDNSVINTGSVGVSGFSGDLDVIIPSIKDWVDGQFGTVLYHLAATACFQRRDTIQCFIGSDISSVSLAKFLGKFKWIKLVDRVEGAFVVTSASNSANYYNGAIGFMTLACDVRDEPGFFRSLNFGMTRFSVSDTGGRIAYFDVPVKGAYRDRLSNFRFSWTDRRICMKGTNVPFGLLVGIRQSDLRILPKIETTLRRFKFVGDPPSIITGFPPVYGNRLIQVSDTSQPVLCHWAIREESGIGHLRVVSRELAYDVRVNLCESVKANRVYAGWGFIRERGVILNPWFYAHTGSVVKQVRLLTHRHSVLDKYGVFAYGYCQRGDGGRDSLVYAVRDSPFFGVSSGYDIDEVVHSPVCIIDGGAPTYYSNDMCAAPRTAGRPDEWVSGIVFEEYGVAEYFPPRHPVARGFYDALIPSTTVPNINIPLYDSDLIYGC